MLMKNWNEIKITQSETTGRYKKYAESLDMTILTNPSQQ